MTAKINFSKIQKCHQIWDDMPVCDSGRLCQQCDRVIHDFRGVSDWDIAVKHANSSDKVCGIYDEHTLNGTSQNRTIPFNNARKAVWAAAMTGLTSITMLSAQSQSNDSVHILENDLNVKDSIPDQNRDSSRDTLDVIKPLIVKGKIIEKEMQEGIIAATIIIAGTANGTVSDVDGNFTLDLTHPLSEQDSVKLIVSYVGYAKFEKTIHLDQFKTDHSIVLEEEIMLIEDYSLSVFGVVRPPWYKRVWYKITKVFR